MITFQEEYYTQLFTKEFMDLYKMQWKEIGAFDKQKIKLSPDWDVYRIAGKQNKISVFTVRDKEKLIGYSIFFIIKHYHYKNTVIAENDILFLIPEYRKGFTGYKFIKYCVEELKSKVEIIIWGMKVEYSFGSIVKRLGFTLMDHTFILEV